MFGFEWSWRTITRYCSRCPRKPFRWRCRCRWSGHHVRLCYRWNWRENATYSLLSTQTQRKSKYYQHQSVDQALVVVVFWRFYKMFSRWPNWENLEKKNGSDRIQRHKSLLNIKSLVVQLFQSVFTQSLSRFNTLTISQMKIWELSSKKRYSKLVSNTVPPIISYLGCQPCSTKTVLGQRHHLPHPTIWSICDWWSTIRCWFDWP